jgi:hypothetical protein
LTASGGNFVLDGTNDRREYGPARAKPAPVKKAARKVKPPVAPVVESVAETVAVEVIEQPVTVTEVDEIRKAS